MKHAEEVILFSAGLDSLIAAQLFPDAVLLNINFRGPCSEKELRVIRKLEAIAPRIGKRIVYASNIIDLSNSALDDGDGTILNRNAILVLIAAMYGKNIILNGTQGDIHLDKDLGFAERMNDLLEYMNRVDATPMVPCHHVDGIPALQVHNRPTGFQVHIPFHDKGKPDLVHGYIKAQGDIGLLALAMSCTDPKTGGQCGVCRPCLRKFFALAWNRIYITNWDNDPAAKDHRATLINVERAIHEGTWTRCVRENEQTLSVIDPVSYYQAAKQK